MTTMLLYTSDNLNIGMETEMFLRKRAELYWLDINQKHPQPEEWFLTEEPQPWGKSQCGICNLSVNIQINGRLRYLRYSFSIRDYDRSTDSTLPKEERIGTDYGSISTIIDTINQLWYNVDYMQVQRKVISALWKFVWENEPTKPI